jgi:hypothetical protein
MKSTGERGVCVCLCHITKPACGKPRWQQVRGGRVAQPQLQSGLGRIAWAGRPMRSRHWRCPGVLHSSVAPQAFYLPAQPGSPMCAYTTCLGRYIKVASS